MGISLDLWMVVPVGLSWLSALATLLVWQNEWRRHRLRSSTVWLLLAIASLGAALHHDAWRWYGKDGGSIGLQ